MDGGTAAPTSDGSAYGFHVTAPWPLLGIAPSSRQRAREVRLVERSGSPYPANGPHEDPGHVRRVATDVGERWTFGSRSSGWVTYDLDLDRSTLSIERSEGVDAEVPRTLAIHPLLGIMARLGGATTLHATTVSIEGRAVALVGPSGSGKSSLALALCQSGARLLAEDVSAMTVEDGVVFVEPGLGHLRVGRDIATTLLGGAAHSLAPMFEPAPGTGLVAKLVWWPAVRESQPTPIGAIVFVDPTWPVAGERITAVPGMHAVRMMAANLFGDDVIVNRPKDDLQPVMVAAAQARTVRLRARREPAWLAERARATIDALLTDA